MSEWKFDAVKARLDPKPVMINALACGVELVNEVVTDNIHDGESVNEHRYHGLVCMCVRLRKCAPGNDTTSVNKDNREGSYE